ncbi:hypothetical protein [Thalassospira sp. CH_XMU1458]|uniref:hypothetical protein n=1 Tax=Thalassospira sp. CH_XMU1458 TaxID=3107776 RepID=UPI00300D3046
MNQQSIKGGSPLFTGDVHAHFFGTATLSFADGVTTEDEDEFEIESPLFGRPIRNRLMVQAERPVTVKAI